MNAQLFNKLNEGPQQRPYEVWGQVAIDAFEAVLVKGVGKKPFDPQSDDPNKKVIAVKVEVLPLAEMGENVKALTRDMIDQSKEWGLTLNSFKNQGVLTENLPGAWCRATVAPTGETFTNKEGEKKDKTYIKFVAFFPDYATCAADYRANGNGSSQAQAQPDPASAPAPASNGNGGAPALDASKFLKPLAKNAAAGESDPQKVLDKLAAMLPGMPALAARYTKDSPEVIAAVMEAMTV